MEENELDKLKNINFDEMNDENIFKFLRINKENDFSTKKSKKYKIKVEDIDKHEKVLINDKPYYFPFKPYKSQLKFCESIVNSLESNSHCSLESPTGTGKTISLIVSTLGYLYNLQNMGENANKKIIYVSRTHSQLNQVCNEVKKSCYKPIISFLASRDKYCINSKLNKVSGHAKQIECNNLIKNRNCEYFIGNELKNYNKNDKYSIFDIEDIIVNSKWNTFCPYYFNKKKSITSNLILMPYNYLIDDIYRNLMTDILNDSILIVDEAHNFPKFLEDGGSFTITSEHLKKSLEELKTINLDNMTAYKMAFDNVLINKLIEKFLKKIKEFDLNGYKTSEKDEIYKLDKILELFDILKITENLGNLSIFYKKIISSFKILDLLIIKKGYIYSNLVIFFKFIIKSKSIIENFIKNNDEYKNVYRIYLKKYPKIVKNKQTIEIFEYNILCLNPSVVMKKILKVNFHTIIFTSGTIGNINMMENETNLKFKFKHSFPHVIDIEKQLYIRIVKSFNQNMMNSNTNNKGNIVKANFSFVNRSNINLKKEAANFILNMSKKIPQGLLVYFTSYKILKEYHQYLESNNIIKEIQKYKAFYMENNKQSLNFINKYKKSCSENGAILFLVFNGKFSEGIDFKDEMSRGILIFGIPYINKKEKKTEAKINILNDININSSYNGNFWYQEQAILSINQTIGRLLRHKEDFGSVFLIDERYENPTVINKLSEWVKNYVKLVDASLIINELELFFKDKIEKFKLKRPIKNKITYINEKNNYKNPNSNLDFNSMSKYNNYIKKKITTDRKSFTSFKDFENKEILKKSDDTQIYDYFKKVEKKEDNTQDKIVINPNNTQSTNFLITNKINSQNIDPSNNNENSKISCPVCYKEYSPTLNFLKSKCNHIACGQCWLKSLEVKLECIICRFRVRFKNLKEFKI